MRVGRLISTAKTVKTSATQTVSGVTDSPTLDRSKPVSVEVSSHSLSMGLQTQASGRFPVEGSTLSAQLPGPIDTGIYDENDCFIDRGPVTCGSRRDVGFGESKTSLQGNPHATKPLEIKSHSR